MAASPPDYAIQFSGSLVQCELTTLTWKGNSNDPKIIKAFITGENYFFETLTPQPLTASLGSLEYLVDVPSGLSLQFQLYNSATPPSNLTYAVTSSNGALVQPGKTDECLRKNLGQEAVGSMEGLAEEMSLKSPQLFTGYTTVKTSLKSTTSTLTPSLTSAPSSTPTSSSPPSSSSPSTVVLAGSIAGGVIGAFLILSIMTYLCLRRKKRNSSLSTLDSHSQSQSQGFPRVNTLTTEAGRVGRVDTWRQRIFPNHSERPLSRLTTNTTGNRAPSLLLLPSHALNAGVYRRGIPEVGEKDDRELYEGSAPTRTGGGGGGGGRRFPLFSRNERGEGMGGGIERMRTPGVMTEKGDGEEEEEEGMGREYESYRRE